MGKIYFGGYFLFRIYFKDSMGTLDIMKFSE